MLELFTRLGALDSSDHCFALFVQGLLSGAVTPDEDHQRAMAAALASVLARANLNIIETGHVDGYPDFAIVAAGAAARPPQLILFASTSKKPDLRLRARSSKVELVNNASEVLRYDRPIPESGLRWDQLQAWWADRENLAPDDAKRSLWLRLRSGYLTNMRRASGDDRMPGESVRRNRRVAPSFHLDITRVGDHAGTEQGYTGDSGRVDGAGRGIG